MIFIISTGRRATLEAPKDLALDTGCLDLTMYFDMALKTITSPVMDSGWRYAMIVLPVVLVLVLKLATTKEYLSIQGVSTSRCLLTDIRLLRLLGGMMSITNLYNDAATASFIVKTAIYEDTRRKGLEISVISQT